MKHVFKIIIDGNPIQLALGRNVLDILIIISRYIHENNVASDFFTIGNTRDHAVAEFLEILQEAKSRMKPEDDNVVLSLKREFDTYDGDQYNILERVLWYGSNFGDDISDLEPLHDDIWDVYHACFPQNLNSQA
ncbi:hypothetical protein [Paraglaciecola hydrolytica]|uniref:Uncharacterized protein n=1 Tax=Paraglaciecola hydrolytica TaxID=1799789 RepID=A0A148KKA2_9ALTE|nr:hypothetical protein [Paraglaciecola hydrolytica]KXI26710.1 hypothetical protein AX660_02740 [Paraglaciecola hydrolytica]